MPGSKGKANGGLAAAKARVESLGPDAPPDHEAVLRVVHAMPGREGCATLAWTALERALTGAAATD